MSCPVLLFVSLPPPLSIVYFPLETNDDPIYPYPLHQYLSGRRSPSPQVSGYLNGLHVRMGPFIDVFPLFPFPSDLAGTSNSSLLEPGPQEDLNRSPYRHFFSYEFLSAGAARCVEILLRRPSFSRRIQTDLPPPPLFSGTFRIDLSV